MAEIAIADTLDLSTNLKAAMRGFAQSVVIVTTARAGGDRHAMAATAVTPLSMDPPSMLMCVNRSTASHPILENGADFCLNVLRSDQADIARACGGAVKGEARFTTGQWELDDQGIPYLADAQAVIGCHQRKRISYGSHDIFIGDVRFLLLPVPYDPLVYVDGTYRKVGERI